MSKGKGMFGELYCTPSLGFCLCIWNGEAEGVKRRSEGWGNGGFRWTGKEGFSSSGHPEAIL